MLQDTPFTSAEFAAFQKTATKRNYRVYWQPGHAHESGRKTGGITTLVPKNLNQQPVQHSFDLPSHVYVHIVHIHGTAVINIYAPPGEQKKMADLLMDVWISHNLGGYPWIVAGDTNETQDGHIAAALEQLKELASLREKPRVLKVKQKLTGSLPADLTDAATWTYVMNLNFLITK